MTSAHRSGESPTSEPRPSLRAPDRPSDWGSLVADLSRGRDEPTVHVHDKTHLELAIDYRLRPGRAVESFVWEAYFFAPESLRLDSRTYDKTDIYTDLQTYVRFEVPDVEFADLAGEPIDKLRTALEGSDEAAVREMRLFACQVRAAGVELRARIIDALGKSERERHRAEQAAARMVSDCQRIGQKLRDALAQAAGRGDLLETAAKWVDEDVSRLIETLLATVSRHLDTAGAPRSLIDLVAQAAIAEAHYRDDIGIGRTGRLAMTEREIEALEFRRHLLKRFTSSVLWLSPEVRPAATWVREISYAAAASIAMAFAIGAAIWNGFAVGSQGVITWVLVGVVAYAVKDRIKALLQSKLSSVVDRHFPDRRWRIRDRERAVVLGEMNEQSGFVPMADLPAPVLAARRLTRGHELEEQARPETVLFHKKEVQVQAQRVALADPRFSALTEIFRLDVSRWLAHTDDPKRDIVFADPVANQIGAAKAPRVYNLAVVFRLRRADDPNSSWHRLRVVVSRKGIRRIERIV